MELGNYKTLVVSLANEMGFVMNLESLSGIDCFLPFINKMKEDSSVVLIKVDGEREENIYTLLISGKKLGQGVLIRTETSDLEGGLSYICVEYAKKVWGWRPS